MGWKTSALTTRFTYDPYGKNPCEKNEEPAPISMPGTPPHSFQLNSIEIGRENPYEGVKRGGGDVFS
jgi:hypothetical protein